MSDWIEDIPSAWKGHRKFAQWLVNTLGARIIVELGVDRGYSLFSFASEDIDLIYGIDLWQPDLRYGYDNYKPTLEQQARDHGLSHRIKLIQGEFGEIAKVWPSIGHMIDVLHIDGTHEYNAVKADYTNWKDYVKYNGVIIFHDVCIPDFTVKEFFNEIMMPKAWFEHSCGLGIVCKNEYILQKICSAFPEVHLGNVV